VHGLADLAQPGLRFINRQSGSGTRVWLDASLHRLGIPVNQIQGYTDEKMTHFDVARAIAESQADVGLGLEAAARTYGLDFVLLTQERYDLVIPAQRFDTPPMQTLVGWINSQAAREAISRLVGYDTTDTGKITRL
jgi:putative molybdopterin biosynthesis protein